MELVTLNGATTCQHVTFLISNAPNMAIYLSCGLVGANSRAFPIPLMQVLISRLLRTGLLVAHKKQEQEAPTQSYFSGSSSWERSIETQLLLY